MNEYALTKDGLTVDHVRFFHEAPSGFGPEHPTKSEWKWLAVTRLPGAEGAQPGWTLDTNAGTAVYRAAYVAHVPRRVGTAREFTDLLTNDEKAALLVKARTDVATQLWITEAMAGNVSLDHPTLLPALQAQEADGTLDEGRAAEIYGADFDAQS